MHESVPTVDANAPVVTAGVVGREKLAAVCAAPDALPAYTCQAVVPIESAPLTIDADTNSDPPLQFEGIESISPAGDVYGDGHQDALLTARYTRGFADGQWVRGKSLDTFLPIGDLYTMSPREAAVACRLLQAPVVVPMHFGTFPPLTGTPGGLEKLVKGTRVWELQPGKTATAFR